MSNPPPAKRRPPRPGKAKASIGGGENVLLDTAEHTPAVSPYADAEWRKSAPLTLADLPEPPAEQSEETGPLTEVERTGFKLCEAAIEAGIRGFVLMGRALEWVQKTRAYRAEHDTFEDYCRARWGIGRDRAEQFINAWRLGAAILERHPSSNEGQVRPLLPVEAEHGRDAAVLVYETVANNSAKVTASVLAGAVEVLPARWRKADVVKAIKDYLRDGVTRTTTAPEVRRVVKGLRDVTRDLRTAESPEQCHEVAVRLRSLADEVDSPSS